MASSSMSGGSRGGASASRPSTGAASGSGNRGNINTGDRGNINTGDINVGGNNNVNIDIDGGYGLASLLDLSALCWDAVRLGESSVKRV